MTDNIEIPFVFPQIPDDTSDDARRMSVELRRIIDAHILSDGGPKEFVDVVVGSKGRLTPLGGLAVLLTNKTGSASVQGELVKADSITDSAVSLAGTGNLFPIGMFVDSGIANGSGAWIVVSGIGLVKADATGYSKGDRITMSTATAGRVEANNNPSVAVHFTEVGHALQDAAANAVGLCNVHFL